MGQTTKNVNGQTWYFAGWYDNEALAGEPYSFSGKTMPAHDLILYASWTTKTYTVTFDYNDGTGHTTQIDNVPYGSTVAEPEEPTREGYLFAGVDEGRRTVPLHDPHFRQHHPGGQLDQQ